MPAGGSLHFFAESDESVIRTACDSWTWARIYQGVVYNCKQCIVMQMLEWVLSSLLNACCKFTLVYQCNESEMGLHCCDVNSEDSGCFTSARNSEQKLRPNKCSKHFPQSLRSETPGNSEHFEGGIKPATHRRRNAASNPPWIEVTPCEHKHQGSWASGPYM